jgi:hypothetical protein
MKSDLGARVHVEVVTTKWADHMTKKQFVLHRVFCAANWLLGCSSNILLSEAPFLISGCHFVYIFVNGGGVGGGGGGGGGGSGGGGEREEVHWASETGRFGQHLGVGSRRVKILDARCICQQQQQPAL